MTVNSKKGMKEIKDDFSLFAELFPVGMIISSFDGTILEVNQNFIEIFGYSREELIGNNSLINLNLWVSPDIRKKLVEMLQKKTFIKDKEVGIISKSGELKTLLISARKIEYDNQSAILSIVDDITLRKQVEEEKEITLEFLQFINQSRNINELIKTVVCLFQQHTGCAAVGIRLKNGDDYPYFEAHGFPQEFIWMENKLCEYDQNGVAIKDSSGNPILECMCGNVIRGWVDLTQPFFTEKGSFWTNNTSQLLASTTEADRKSRTRNRCNGEGYESVALIPIRLGSECFGLLQLNDKQTGRFTLDFITFWERLADYMAIAISKFRIEEALQKSEIQLNLALESSRAGIWEMNLRTRKTYYSNELLKLYMEYSQFDKLTSLEQWLQIIHPEDRPKISLSIQQALQTKKTLNIDWRVEDKEGNIRWFISRGKPLLDENGEVDRFMGVSMDITELKNAEMELVKAKEAAEVANNAKSRFLANMSHEIRTPMNGIIGLTDLLLHTELDSTQQEYLDLLRYSANILLQLINDILDLSKIEAGNVELCYEDFDLQDLIGNIMKTFQPLANQKGIDLVINTDQNVPRWVKGDILRFKQIVMNILNNAIKFTARGYVEVTLNHVADSNGTVKILLRVKDTGIGIDQNKIEDIFERFHQADQSTTKKYGGTGLGLAIVKHLVKMMKGEIYVKSEPGVGSVFYLTIPFEKADNIRTQPNLQVDNYEENNHCIQILLAEDNKINQKATEDLLKFEGYKVVTVENGQMALDELERNCYQLILMDIQMPVMDGIEATAIIRRQEMETGRHIPIIALTAYAMEGDREKFIQAGMDDYLAKPVRMEDLYQTVDRYVK